MKTTIVIAVLAAVVLVNVQDATAYSYFKCYSRTLKWKDNNATIRASKVAFTQGNSAQLLRTHLEYTLARYNEAPGNFRFNNVVYGDTSVGRNNGQNEVWFSNNNDLLGTAPAVCLMRWSCLPTGARMREADVVLRASQSWAASFKRDSLSTYGSTARSLTTVMMHEFGHALGLAHTNNTYNIMGSDATHIHNNGTNLRMYPGEDAAHGMVFIYGTKNTSNPNDLGVTHFRYGGASGEYSTHVHCRIFNPGGSARDTESWRGSLRRHILQKGLQYEVEFTYENNGRDNFSGINCALYVSTNDQISTSDRQVRTFTLNLARNKVATLRTLFTLPADLTVGQTYFLGVIVDRTQSIAEFSEFNNATYLPIRIAS